LIQLGLPPVFPLPLLILALPVYPMVRLSDKGMVDVMTQLMIPMVRSEEYDGTTNERA